MCKFLFFFLMVIVHSLSGQKMPGLPFSNYYSSSVYGGGMQNWAISQSKEGMLYVANNFGLLEYDGTQWRKYSLPTSTKIRDVVVARNEYILVAGQGDFGYFAPDQRGLQTFTSLADSLSEENRNFDETWRILQTDKEWIFCTFRKLFVFDNSGHYLRTITPSHTPTGFVIVNNKLYVSENEFGLCVLSDERLQLIEGGEFFSEMVVTGVILLSGNRLWVTTKDNGIFISNNKGKFNSFPSLAKITDTAGSINTILRLSNGLIAIGTQFEGVYLVNDAGEILQHFSKGRGLNSRTVLTLFEDINQNLWIGHNNGISQIELSLPFLLINEQTGLPGSGYDACLDDNYLYLGTNNGLYQKELVQGTHAPFQQITGTEDQVYFIDKVDGYLILGHQNGAYSIRGSSSEKVSDEPGAWTFLPLQNHPGYILGGNYNGLTLFHESGEKLEFVRKVSGLMESSRVMEQDEKGQVWMTHGYKGVYQLTLSDDLDSVYVHHYSRQDGLPSDLLINVWRINNRLVFSTQNGIYQYDPDQDRFEKDEFFSHYFEEGTGIISMAEDPIGNIYYVASNEMGVLNKQMNGEYRKETKVFSRIRQLLNDDLQKICVLEANLVMFAAKEGFVVYNNQTDAPVTRQSFTTMIRGVSLITTSDSLLSSGTYRTTQGARVTQPASEIPILTNNQNSIQIKYSAPFLSHQEGTMYQYMLENYEANYGEWTARTEKEYTNLPAGTYTFFVRAKNIYNQVSQATSYTFVIKSPWYLTPVAYLFYFFITSALVVLFILFVERKYKRKTKRLTLDQQRELIKKDTALKSRQDEIDRLKNEKLKAEINTKNKELATSTMLLIHKNSFMNGVKHTLSHLIRQSNNREIKEEIDKVMHTIDRNIAQDDTWEQFEIHFDRVHGDFASRFRKDFKKLSPQEIKLSAYLRMNLSTKEIAHLMNISIRGVEVARYRLRKKLDLDRSENLQEYILRY